MGLFFISILANVVNNVVWKFVALNYSFEGGFECLAEVVI